eukprot:TRINITY_DN32194_c0_g1_i1.p1 TRINITY_DN32194_c0_g1~~TRINITY_DN32194_c0_g1_i1.p1  ORF type:complete len:358 (+),score=106.44 TRINITY_DN32194_c0_g1_i1:188-1261(+)
MKITARPLKGEPFELEVQPTDDVEAVRAQIAALKPDLLVQKLVYAGRVLAGGTMQEAGLKDGEVLVVMTKPKAAEPPPPAPEPEPPAAAPVPPPSVPATSSTADAGDAAMDQAAAGASAGFEATVSTLCEMGFPRSQVEACVRAAFGNADRAVEYLMGGIPPSVMQQQAAAAAQPPPQPAPPPAAPPAAGGAAPGGFGGMPFPGMVGAPAATGPLAQLRNHPRFPQLRAAVQSNPQVLSQVLALIASTDPSLMPLIAEHQQEFVEALQEPVAPPAAGGGRAQDPMAAMLAAAQAAQAQAPAAPAPPPPPPQLSAAEEEAIGRLTALGFARPLATQAYLACNKNEEMAADMLFTQMEG